jgi:hypothetical protein
MTKTYLFFLPFPGAHLEVSPKGPADIKIAESGHEIQSDAYTLQDSVEEQDGELGSSDDSSVHSDLSQGLLQGKLYLSIINISNPFLTLFQNK